MTNIVLPITFFICELIFLWVLGRNLLRQVRKDFNKNAVPTPVARERKTDIFGKTEIIESGSQSLPINPLFQRFENLIAIFTGLAFFGAIYSIGLEKLYQIVLDFAQRDYVWQASLVGGFFIIGLASGFFIFYTLLQQNNNQSNNLFLQWYLSFLFFALLSILVAEFTFEYNLLKSSVLAFLFGNGFYFILTKGKGL